MPVHTQQNFQQVIDTNRSKDGSYLKASNHTTFFYTPPGASKSISIVSDTTEEQKVTLSYASRLINNAKKFFRDLIPPRPVDAIPYNCNNHYLSYNIMILIKIQIVLSSLNIRLTLFVQKERKSFFYVRQLHALVTREYQSESYFYVTEKLIHKFFDNNYIKHYIATILLLLFPHDGSKFTTLFGIIMNLLVLVNNDIHTDKL
ncbi:hypothetical protein BDC45DRAFT_553049 [Circinella umbellata]|nr:hypothetical protein BDC45DRAFT_553049 [Circinella umbellata]